MKTFARIAAALVVVSAFSFAAAKGKPAALQQTAYDKLAWTEMMPIKTSQSARVTLVSYWPSSAATSSSRRRIRSLTIRLSFSK